MTSPRYIGAGEDGTCSGQAWADVDDWTLSLGRDTVLHATNYWLVSRFPPGTVLARIVFVFPACYEWTRNRTVFLVRAHRRLQKTFQDRSWVHKAVQVSHVSHLRRMTMNRTTFVRSMQSKKRKRNPARKPKIRWEVLGLSGPQGNEEATSIDSIRQAVSSMASRGLGQGTRSRMKGAASEEGSPAGARGSRRREATK